MNIEYYIAGYDFPINSNFLLNGGFENTSYWLGSSDQSSNWYDSSNYFYGSKGFSFFQASIQVVNSASGFFTSVGTWDDGVVAGSPYNSVVGADTRLSIEKFTSTPERGYIRVESVNITQGATINSANLFFWVQDNKHPSFYFELYALDVDNASRPVSGTPAYVLSSDLTNAYSRYTLPGTFWSTYSLDFRAQLQEIVNRPGWSQYNAVMAIFVPLSRNAALSSWEYAQTQSMSHLPKLFADWSWTV